MCVRRCASSIVDVRSSIVIVDSRCRYAFVDAISIAIVDSGLEMENADRLLHITCHERLSFSLFETTNCSYHLQSHLRIPYEINICNYHLQSIFAITIWNWHLQLPFAIKFAIAIWKWLFQLQFAIYIFECNMKLTFTTTISNQYLN